MRGFGLADDLGDQRVDGDVERFGSLVAAVEDLGRQPVAGLVDLADQIAAAQLQFQQQRVARITQRIVHQLGAVGDAIDDAGGACLEIAGDAVQALVQHVVDAIGKVDEFVVDVAGLEVEAGGQAFAGIEHGARGFRAGFLEPVEQVAAALAERQDHVVAGVAQRLGDVGAALFQRAGDRLGDLIDARGDGVRDQRDVVAQIDLHAGNRRAHLLGLADQVVALVRDVLQQRADADFIVGVGAFQRGDLIGDEGFEFAGARDRTFDAVAHRGYFAADRLADGDHRIAGGPFGFGEPDCDLRHRLRDHAQLLAAPRQTGEEVEQQDRGEEQDGKAGQRQRAAGALADEGLQRRQERDGEQSGADHPDAGKQRRQRVDVAGGAALLDRLQDLADGLAIVIGRAARKPRLVGRVETRPVRDARLEGALVIGGTGNRTVVANRRSIAIDRRVADVQGFLNGRQRNFRRILGLLGVVCHLRPTPLVYASGTPRNFSLHKGTCPDVPRERSPRTAGRSACPLFPQTSYWLGHANEMDSVKTFLIIVNSTGR